MRVYVKEAANPSTVSETVVPKKLFCLILAILIVFNLLVVFALYQTRPLYQLDMASANDKRQISSFFAREQNERGFYRWTRSKGMVNLPLVGTPCRIEVTGAAYRPKELELEPPTIRLAWDNPNVERSFQVTASQAEFGEVFSLPLEGGTALTLGGETGRLTIFSDTFQPGGGDPRRLGMLVEKVTIQAYPNQLGLIIPPATPWLAISTALLAMQGTWGFFLARQLNSRGKWLLAVLGGALALVLAVVVVFWFSPTFFLTNVLFIALSLGAVALLSGLILQLKWQAGTWLLLIAFSLALSFVYAPPEWTRFEKTLSGLGLSGLAALVVGFNATKSKTSVSTQPEAKESSAVGQLGQGGQTASGHERSEESYRPFAYALGDSSPAVAEADTALAPPKVRFYPRVIDWGVRRWVWLTVSGFMLLSLFPRLYNLDEMSLWLDETIEYYSAAIPLEKLLDGYYADHIPVSLYPSSLMLKLFPSNTSEGFLRLHSLLFGLALIPVAYLLGKELFGRRGGIITAWLCIFSPVLVNYSQEYRVYSLYVLITTASAYFMVRATRTNQVSAWFGFVACTMLAVFLHLNTLFPLLSMWLYTVVCLLVGGISYLLQKKSWREAFQLQKTPLLYAVGAWLLVTIAYLPILTYLLGFLNSPILGLSNALKAVALDVTTLQQVNAWYGVGKGLGGDTFLVLFFVGFGWAIWRYRLAAAFCFLWLSVPFIILSQAKGGEEALTVPRYLIFLVPVYLALVANGVVAISGAISFAVARLKAYANWRKPLQSGLIVIVCLVLAFQALQALPDYYNNPKPLNVELKDAFAYVKADLRPGDVVLGLQGGSIDHNFEEMWFYYFYYYLRDVSPEVNRIAPPGSPLDKNWGKAVEAPGRLWTLITTERPPQVLNLTDKKAKAQCFRNICAVLQPDQPGVTMRERIRAFLSKYRSINPKFVDNTLKKFL